MATLKWIDKRFGQALKKQRERRGWTQPQMAEMLVFRGLRQMHDTTLAKIEAGSRSVRINEAAAIADLFGVSVDDLLGRASTEDPEVAISYGLQELRDVAQYRSATVRRMSSELSDALDCIAFSGNQFAGAVLEETGQAADAAYKDLDSLQEHLRELVKLADQAIARRQQLQPAERTDN